MHQRYGGVAKCVAILVHLSYWLLVIGYSLLACQPKRLKLNCLKYPDVLRRLNLGSDRFGKLSKAIDTDVEYVMGRDSYRKPIPGRSPVTHFIAL